MQRSARFISIEDFLFLARKDREKLRRLIKFLHFKDQKQKFAKMLGGMEEEETYSETGRFCWRHKRGNTLQEVLLY